MSIVIIGRKDSDARRFLALLAAAQLATEQRPPEAQGSGVFDPTNKAHKIPSHASGLTDYTLKATNDCCPPPEEKPRNNAKEYGMSRRRKSRTRS